ncbi:MAG: helix-turn-helix domain-containing protein [Bacteroidales bacterium]|jgi:transcriptional regulator with XRE-family HTH domain|nr:helix-turn-helix domain-containing protein [Bacteroidales bacterium]
MLLPENKNYLEKLIQNSEFKEKFKEEYQNVCIGEQIAKARYKAKLTQEELARRINKTKSAISRYESDNYQGYSIRLLNKLLKPVKQILKLILSLKQNKFISFINSTRIIAEIWFIVCSF